MSALLVVLVLYVPRAAGVVNCLGTTTTTTIIHFVLLLASGAVMASAYCCQVSFKRKTLMCQHHQNWNSALQHVTGFTTLKYHVTLNDAK